MDTVTNLCQPHALCRLAPGTIADGGAKEWSLHRAALPLCQIMSPDQSGVFDRTRVWDCDCDCDRSRLRPGRCGVFAGGTTWACCC